jgi:hypothetical protein
MIHTDRNGQLRDTPSLPRDMPTLPPLMPREPTP